MQILPAVKKALYGWSAADVWTRRAQVSRARDLLAAAEGASDLVSAQAEIDAVTAHCGFDEE